MTRHEPTVRRVAVIDDYLGVAADISDWRGRLHGTQVDFFREPIPADELVATLRSYDVVVLMRERTRVSRSTLASLPNLRLLVTTGMRNSAIDLAAAEEHGVTVCGTRSGTTQTAELTWALILATVRNVKADDGAIRAGQWQSRLDGDLSGRRLGVVGLGRIGTRVARIAVAFGMYVIAWSPNLTAERVSEPGVRAVGKAELFGSSDIVSLHLVLAPSTRGVIGAEELSLMRRDAWLINTARAGLVDQEPLITALVEGKIAGAALDVFDAEPLPNDDPIRRAENTLLTPHMGYVTKANYQLFYDDAISDIAAFSVRSPIRRLA